MDEGEPSQLYRTLLLEQELNPSQAVGVLIAYYQMSEEEAQLVSREYHARGVNGHTRKQPNKSHKGNRKSTKGNKRPYMLASLRRGNSKTS